MIKKKFDSLFYFEPKSKIKAGAGHNKGQYPFYTSSGNLTKKVEIAQYAGNSLIFGTGGQPSVHFSLVPFSTSTDCVVATPRTKEINPQYVYYFLKENRYILQRGFRGAGLKHISKSYIEHLEIPVISIEQQNQIVWILEKAEKLVESQKQSIKILETLIKSVFLDMFGDPVLNPQKHPVVSLFQLGKWKSGGTPSRSKDLYYQGNIPWYTSGELNHVFIFQSKEHINNQAINETSAKLVKAGSLLLGMYDTAALKSSITTVDASCNQAIAFSLLSEKKCNSLYVYMAVQLGKEKHLSQRRGVRQRNLNLSMIKNITIPLPPLDSQNHYALIFNKVYGEIERLKESLRLSETLFKSLFQKAFRGELVINNTEYLLRKAIVELNWLEEQLGLLQIYGFSSGYIKKLAEIRDNEEIDSLSILERTLQENRFPAIKEIVSLKELLYSFDIPFLHEVRKPDQIQRLISHSVFRDTNIREVFEKLQEKNSSEQIEKQIVRESDPVSRYIGEMHYQTIPAGNEQMRLARFIYESFQDKEFTISEVAERLKSEKVIPGIKAGNVKENVFSLLKEFIRTEFYEFPFTFQDLSRQLREKLFHPSFELLHEFIVEELDKKDGLRQMYYPGEMQKLYPGHFQRLQTEKATNKLYLIATYGNRQN